MESLLDNIGNVFDSQFTRAHIIWTLIGTVIILCGLLLMVFSFFYRLKGQAVLLKVIHLHEEAREIKESDDAERIAEKAANPRIRPEFEIMEGPHKGLRKKSSSAGTSSDHELGEVTPGYYFPKSGDIASERQVKSGIKYGFIFIALGGIIIVSAKLFAAS